MEIQLQRLRKKKRMSQKEMADALGVKIRTYGSWERGEAMLNLEQAYRCALILECTIDEIAGMPAPAAALADAFERELVDCYRGSTSEGRAVILGNARGQRELALKTAEGPASEPEGLRAVGMS
nr:MAG TPA: helix-turn-helix domain protein [Caudoviricetes sp.]